MKHLFITFSAALLITSCSSTSEEENGEPVTQETMEQVEQLQETNAELEQLDKDVDSLLTTLE